MNQTAFLNSEHKIGVILNGKRKKQYNNYEVIGEKNRNADTLNGGEVYKNSETSGDTVNSILRTFSGKIVENTFDESFPLTA